MRQVIIFLFLFIISGLSGLNAQVRLTSQIPAEITSGSRVAMTFTIEKKQLENFARFEQALHPGFIAVEDNSRGAEFKFEGNKVSLTWLRLPKDSVFSFSYFLQAADTLSGTFALNGVFSYIYQNNRGYANMSAHNLTVKRVSNISNIPIAYIPNILDIANVYASQKLSLTDTVKGGYQLEIVLSADKDITNLVLTENISGLSKPTIKSDGGAKVTMKDNVLTFTFSKLAANTPSKILVSGFASDPNVIPAVAGSVVYNVEKSYITIAVADKSLPIFVVNSNQAIANNTDAEKKNSSILSKYSNKITGKGVSILGGNKDTENKTETENKTTVNEGTTNSADIKSGAVDSVVVEREASDNKVVVKKETKVTTGNSNKILSKKSDSNKTLSNAGYEVQYSVQIAAFSKEISSQYFKNLGVGDKINIEKHDGLYKYKLGSFNTYADAQKFRDKVIRESNVNEAFIVAYSNNKRIKVADALKLSKKK